MGQPGGADDEGHEAQRDGLTLCVAGLKDHAHAVFTACAVPLIRPGHERSYQPQEGQEPGRVRVTDCAEIQQYPPENGVHRAYGYACRDGNCYENERFFHNFHLITAKKPMLPRAAAAARRSHQLKAVSACGRGGPHPLCSFFEEPGAGIHVDEGEDGDGKGGDKPGVE